MILDTFSILVGKRGGEREEGKGGGGEGEGREGEGEGEGRGRRGDGQGVSRSMTDPNVNLITQYTISAGADFYVLLISLPIGTPVLAAKANGKINGMRGEAETWHIQSCTGM